jgi:uncharacterized protein
MIQFKLLLSISALAVFALAGCAKPGQPAASPADMAEPKRIASVDVAKTAVEPVEITAGGSTEMNVRLAIQSGYHVNANPPTFSYLIPTELAIPAADGVSIGAISYPTGINVKLGFSEKPLAVYEGDIAIKVTMKADKSAKPGERSLSAKLRIQACDDQVCYPPGTRDLTIPVTVK